MIKFALPIAPPVLKPFADTRVFVLMADLHYTVGDTGETITVPRGFVTDLASIPQIFWSAGLAPEGLYSKAAIVHDWLYAQQQCTRPQSDDFLLMAMEESGVDEVTQLAIYAAVRACGRQPWDDDAKSKADGFPTVIPEAYLDFGPNQTWTKYRKYLRAEGVADPVLPLNPPWCALGNSTNPIHVQKAEQQA